MRENFIENKTAFSKVHVSIYFFGTQGQILILWRVIFLPLFSFLSIRGVNLNFSNILAK